MNGTNDSGWIKLHRRFLKSAIWQNPNIARFWTWALLKATHDGYTTTVSFKRITLEPGQFLYNHLLASMETGMSQKVVRSCLDFLKSGDTPEIGQAQGSLPGNRYSIITIMNWGVYQDDDSGEGRRGAGKRASIGQAQGSLINKEGKNVKKHALFVGLSEKEISEATNRVVESYSVNIKPRRIDNSGSKKRFLETTDNLLRSGIPESDLEAAIQNYRRVLLETEKPGTDPCYRKGFQSFFGPREEVWKDYLAQAGHEPPGQANLEYLDHFSSMILESHGQEVADAFRAKAAELGDVDKAREWFSANYEGAERHVG